MTLADDLVAREVMLNRFRRLIAEIGRGALSRNTFEAWEVELLLDLDACQLDARRRPEILKQYVRAVERQMENGPGPPVKLSHYLIQRSRQ